MHQDIRTLQLVEIYKFEDNIVIKKLNNIEQLPLEDAQYYCEVKYKNVKQKTYLYFLIELIKRGESMSHYALLCPENLKPKNCEFASDQHLLQIVENLDDDFLLERMFFRNYLAFKNE
jgi:hypothetical protein